MESSDLVLMLQAAIKKLALKKHPLPKVERKYTGFRACISAGGGCLQDPPRHKKGEIGVKRKNGRCITYKLENIEEYIAASTEEKEEVFKREARKIRPKWKMLVPSDFKFDKKFWYPEQFNPQAELFYFVDRNTGEITEKRYLNIQILSAMSSILFKEVLLYVG